VDVGVGDLLTHHQHADLGGVVDRVEGTTDRLGDRPDLGVERGVEVDPVVDGIDGHDQCVAGRQQRDGEEGDDVVVAPHEAGWDLAVDDPCEEGGHDSQPPLTGRISPKE
jgi:hypothetical protein